MPLPFTAYAAMFASTPPIFFFFVSGLSALFFYLLSQRSPFITRQLIATAVQRCRLSQTLCRLSLSLKSPNPLRPSLQFSGIICSMRFLPSLFYEFVEYDCFFFFVPVSDTGAASSLAEFRNLKCFQLDQCGMCSSTCASFCCLFSCMQISFLQIVVGECCCCFSNVNASLAIILVGISCLLTKGRWGVIRRSVNRMLVFLGTLFFFISMCRFYSYSL